MFRRDPDADLDLHEVIRLLTAENEDLAGRAEDTLLLGLIAERIHRDEDHAEFTAGLLETVCLVKNVAWSACYRRATAGYALEQVYTITSAGREPAPGTPLPDALPRDPTGPPVLLEAAATAALPTGFAASAGLVVPVPAAGPGDRMLVFATEESDGAERLAAARELLGRVGGVLSLRLAHEDRVRNLEADREALDRAVKERSAALVASERRLQAIYDAAFDAFLVLDPDGVIRDVNRQACEDLALTPSALVGRALHGVLAAPFADLAALLSGALAGNVATAALRLARGGGGEVEVEARFGPLRLADEDLVLVLARNVTERNTLRARLDHAQKLELVNSLAGGVAHDFNNVLMAMIGQTELLLLDAGGDPRRRTGLEEILRAGGRGADLTRQLLSFSRRGNAGERVFDLAVLVADALRMLERLVGGDHALDLELPDGPAWIRGDPSRLEQVLLNLVVNARDAMPAGGRIRVALSRHGGTAESHRLTVADQGEGIPPELQARIFEPFYTTKGDGRGTGLGLALVRDAVKEHGGEVRVAASSSAGTVFEVLLPVSAPPTREAPAAGETTPRGGGELILLVEDDPAIRSILDRALSRLGYRVQAAPDGTAALQLARQHPDFGLLVTDVAMPGLKGPDVARELRSGRPDLPVLYVAAYLDGATRAELAADARAEVLDKPVLLHQLGQAVQHLLARG